MSENTNTPSSSGTPPAAEIIIPMSAPGGTEVIKTINAATTAVLLQAEGLEKLAVDGKKASDELTRYGTKAQAQIVEVLRQIKAAEDYVNAEKDLARATDGVTNAASALLVKLEEQVKTFGKNTTEMLRYKAAQLEVSEAAEKYIVELEALIKAEQERRINQARDIELMRMQVAEEADAARKKAELQAIIEKQDYELWVARGKQHADYIKWWEEEVLAQEKQSAERTAIEQKRQMEMQAMWAKYYAEEKVALEEQAAFDARIKEKQAAYDIKQMELRQKAAAEYTAFWEKELLAQEEAEAKATAEAAKLAEAKMVAEVKWAQLSATRQKKILDELQGYRAAGVSEDAIQKLVGAGAISGLANYADIAAKAAKEAEHVGIQTSRATNEIVVLGREIASGRFSRMPGSLSVFAQAIGVNLINPFTVAAVAVAGLAYEIGKGSVEQDKMNQSLIETGNYAGTTADGLNTIAHAAASVEGNVGAAKEAVTKLAASGKFTGEQIQTITNAAVEMEHATGQSVDKTIHQFESLAVQAGITSRNHDEITKAALKLDDQLHFLNPTLVEEILNLEKQGKAADASKLATDTLAETTRQRAKEMEANLGYVSRAWNAVKDSISKALDKLGDWGKKQTPGMDVAHLQEQIVHIDAGDFGNVNDPAVQNRRKTAVEELAKAQAQLNKETTIANQIGAEQQNRSKANHAAAEIAMEDTKAQRHSLTAYQEAVQKYQEQLKVLRADNSTEDANPALSEDAIAKHMANLKKLYDERPKKSKAAPNDGRRQELMADLTSVNGEYEEARRSVENNKKLLEEAYRSGTIEGQTYYGTLKIARDEELAELDNAYKQKVALLTDYQGRNKVDAAQAMKQLEEVKNWYKKQKDDIQTAGALLDMKQGDEAKKRQENVMLAIEKSGEKEVESLQKKIEKQKEYNDQFSGGKAAKLDDIQRITDAEQKQNEVELALDQRQLESGTLDDKATERLSLRVEWLQRIIAQQKEYSGLLGKGDALTRQKKDQDNFTKQLEEGVQAANKFEKGMTSAFGKTGKAIGEAVVQLAEYNKRQNQIEIDKKAALTAAGKDDKAIEAANTKAQNEQLDNQIGLYAGLADSAKGFFSEGTRGYQMMDGVSKVFHAVQVAMMAKEMILLAQKAVLTQAGGDPYTAFARMAAMAAAVAALGFAVGGGFDRSSGESTMSKDAVQKAQGTGTVLGDITAKSESLSKAMDLVAKNSNDTMPISQAMLKSLKGIESAMANLANVLYRTAGITSGNTLGIPISEVDKKLGGIWGKTTKDLVDSGLMIQNGATVGQLSQGQGFNQYGTVKTTDSSWFGLVKDTSYGRVTGGLDDAVSKQLSLVFKNVEQTLGSAAKNLGMDADNLKKNVEGVTLNNFLVSLRDLKGQELKDAINNFFSNISDQITKTVISGIDDFQHVGEGYLETFVRLSNSVEGARSLLDKLNVSAIDFHNVVDRQGDIEMEIVQQSIVAAETFGGQVSGVGKIMANAAGSAEDLANAYKDLIKAQNQMRQLGIGQQLTSSVVNGAGTVKDLQTGLSAFQDKFFSQQEKANILNKSVADQFAKLGVVLPKSRDELKALIQGQSVNGQILKTDESGQKLLGQLIALSSEFDQAQTATEELAKAQADAAQQAEDAAQQIKDAWQSITDSIIGEINRIRGVVQGNAPDSLAKAQADFTLTNVQARAGDQDAAKLLPSMSQALLTIAEAQAKSANELATIRAATAGSLELTAKEYSDRYGIKIPGFATGGDFGGGLRLVGEHGPELEATGASRIFSAQQTRAILSANQSGEMQALRQEVVNLRNAILPHLEKTANSTTKSASVLTRNDSGSGLYTTPMPTN